jgi:hypothetical protein
MKCSTARLQKLQGNFIMYDVVVYLSSLPRIADHNRKVQVLTAFAKGVEAQGGSVLLQTEYQVVDCRLAVILGWVGTKISGPHIQLRKDVIARQQQTGGHVMPVDSSCFKFADPHSFYLRYSLDGVFYNTNNYANRGSDGLKWEEIKTALRIGMKPWRSMGNHILICLQRDGGWSMKGTDMAQWADETVRKLRTITQRPIVIRPHPSHPMDLSGLLRLPKVTMSEKTTLDQDLYNAWAAVFYNSSSSVAAVLAGVPVFADDPDCVAWEVANHDLTQINDPLMPDRTQWLHDLSASHWSDGEARKGLIYQHFLPYIN